MYSIINFMVSFEKEEESHNFGNKEIPLLRHLSPLPPPPLPQTNLAN